MIEKPKPCDNYYLFRCWKFNTECRYPYYDDYHSLEPKAKGDKDGQ